MITSAQNPKLKLTRSLMGRSKERRQAGAFVAEGLRLVEEAMTAGWPFRWLLFSSDLNDRGRGLAARLGDAGVDVEQVEPRLLRAISATQTSQGILAVLELQPLPLPAALDFVLILDAIRDPGNLGTLLRSGAAAGVQAVLLPPETTDAFAPKVVRAGMGAHFHLPILSLPWDEIKRITTSLVVYLAEMEAGVSCWQADFHIPLALMIGSEAQGARPAARLLAGASVRIPMPGRAESLNAAVAGSILLFEVVRQRKNWRP